MEEYPDFHGDQPIEHSEIKSTPPKYTELPSSIQIICEFDTRGSKEGIFTRKDVQLNDFFNKKSDKIAIKRGCSSRGGCFCSGACNEIVGYRDRLPGEN